MRNLIAAAAAVFLIGASAGCGLDQSTQADRRTEAEKRQALHDSTFGTMTDTLERAREVEQLQLSRKSELDAALESANGH